MKKILFIFFAFISIASFGQVEIVRVEGGIFYFKGVGAPATEAANITTAINSMSPGRGLVFGDKFLKSDDGEEYEYKFFGAVAQWRKISHGAP